MLAAENPVDTFGSHGARILDIVPGQQTAQRFTGIAREGSKYVVAGVAASQYPGYANANFLVRLEGQPLRGHSRHARPQPISPTSMDQPAR